MYPCIWLTSGSLSCHTLIHHHGFFLRFYAYHIQNKYTYNVCATWIAGWCYQNGITQGGRFCVFLITAAASNACLCNIANTGPRNSIHLSNRCEMCWKKPFLKLLSISDEILSKFDIHDTLEYHQRVRDQRGGIDMISAIRPSLRRGQGWGGCGGDFSRVVILPSLTVWALG